MQPTTKRLKPCSECGRVFNGDAHTPRCATCMYRAYKARLLLAKSAPEGR